jgi:hypothetical protein
VSSAAAFAAVSLHQGQADRELILVGVGLQFQRFLRLADTGIEGFL